MSTMKRIFLLLLLWKWFDWSDGCDLVRETLVCSTVPTEFPPGASILFFVRSVAIGEINSTVFHHDNLASITSGIFKETGITGIADGAFSSFISLESLDLDQNKLTNISHKWLGRPAVLTNLSVSENQISVLSGAVLDGFTNLKKLDLRRNQINTIQPQSFNNLAALALLDLSDNNLTHLTSKMFRPMHKINMRLHGNQWKCSCDATDFFEFIMDLKSRSLLVRPDNVTCASPPSLRGRPVWNVSECSSPTPPGPTPTHAVLTTSPDLTVSSLTTDTGTTFNPRTPNGSDFPSERPQPPQPPQTYPSPPSPPSPPYTTNIVPMLITVIVVLCVLLLLVIILAVLYRRKRSRKTVAPRDQNERVCKEKDCEETHATGHTRWDIETPAPGPLSTARAKSANAILFTSPFGVPGDRDPTLLEDRENKRGAEEEETGGFMAEINKNDSVSSSVTNQQSETTPDSCENVPYLSIGSNPNKSNNVDVKTPPDKSGRGLHRISTWPPTAVQWKERCKREKEKEGDDSAVTAWTEVEFKVSSNLDNPGNLSSNYRQKDTETLKNRAEKQSYCKEDEIKTENDLKETNTLTDADSSSTISDRKDVIFRNSFANVETPEKGHKIKSKSVTRQMVNASSSDRAHSSGRGSKQRAESRRSGSNAPPDGGGEYVFMDLLHEVVQNRGRWTRDRWRQIHVNKQSPQ